MTDKTLTLSGNQFDELRDWMRSVDGKLAGLDSRLTSLEAKVESLETKVDDRLRETRPIWEKVLADVEAVAARIDEMNERFITLAEDMYGLRGKQRTLDRRVTDLERKPA